MAEEHTGRRGRFDLQERLLDFTARVVGLAEALPATRVGNHIGGQLVRCGTSPLANYAEAQSAESRGDFIHKMRIALKELREIAIWLQLVQRRFAMRPPHEIAPLLREGDELIAIFVASIRTAERNQRGQ